MKYQKGFIPVVIAIIVIAAIAVGGGYTLYKNHQQAKNREAVVNTQIATQAQATPSTSSESQKTVVSSGTNTSISADTKIACGNDANCLISAAAQCQTATGSITRSNVEHPLFPGLFVSVKNTFSMKKSGSTCVLNQHTAIQGGTLSATGRAELIKQGVAAAEVDSQVKTVIDAMVKEGIIDSVCKTDNATATSYFTDLKNNYTADVSSQATFGSSTSTKTTSTGRTLVCTS